MLKRVVHSPVRDMWQALGGPPATLESLAFSGEGDLQSVYPVTDFAAGSIAAAGFAIAELRAHVSPALLTVRVDRRLASLWFGMSIRPMGWAMPAPWDPIAGDYQTKDGWIRLHTNAPHHRAAAESILGQHADKTAMAQSVAKWTKTELEAAVIAAGGCAAEMRSLDAWHAHPQGRAIAAEPLVGTASVTRTAATNWVPQKNRPLAGLRVLDLTRVLAGPVASRFLAGYGADVLRIDPPQWDEPGVIPEVTLGKMCARLNLEDAADRQTFERLLADADILLHGYRPGALDHLGYTADVRQKISPGLIDAALCAYGWSGPWAERRGFDSLVQMSAGIAHAGMISAGAAKPIPLPVQALDHATGYLLAAAAIRAVTRRMVKNETSSLRLSLARTAKLLTDYGEVQSEPNHAPENADDLSPVVEGTSWGGAHRLRPPVEVRDAGMFWNHPARALGSSPAAWP